MDESYFDSSKGIVDLVSKVREASNRFIQEELNRYGIKGIVPAHGQLLFPLFLAGGALPLGGIVKSSGRAKSTITGMADTLEKKGYIQRHVSGMDKRSVLVELTDKGKALEMPFFLVSEKLLDVIFRDISSETRRIITEGLAKIESNLWQEMHED